MLDRLRIAHVKDKPSSAHTFNYIVLRVKPGLTSCEDIATALVMWMPWDQSKGPNGQGALIFRSACTTYRHNLGP